MPSSRSPSAVGAETGVVLWVGAGHSGRPADAFSNAPESARIEFEDPYAAMAELCRRPDQVVAVVLSLAGLYREELRIIPAIRRASAKTEVWLTEIDGRPAALAEAMRLGADGLLGEEGLHRLSNSTEEAEVATPTDDASAVSPTASVNGQSVNGHSVNGHSHPETSIANNEPQVRRVAEAPVPSEHAPEPSLSSISLPADEPLEPATRLSAAARRAARREAARSPAPGAVPASEQPAYSAGDPLLTADELRALLHDPSGNGFGG